MNEMLYFAYGSNLLPARIEERLGRCPSKSTAWLDGYTLTFHKRGGDGSGKADAYRSGVDTDRVYGRLFQLTSAQKTELDGFEGPGYSCELVRVELVKDTAHAWIYVAKPEYVDLSLTPFDWYHQLVEQGARVALFPQEYVARIRNIASMGDPDVARSRKHFSLLTSALSREEKPID